MVRVDARIHPMIVSLLVLSVVQCKHRRHEEGLELSDQTQHLSDDPLALLNERPEPPANLDCVEPTDPTGLPTADAGACPLYFCYEGEWYEVIVDEFVIGRGSKFSDLPIEDAAISRRHAAIVRRDGKFNIKDLGSTKGIEYQGRRVENLEIGDGDVVYLADHRFRFSYAPPKSFVERGSVAHCMPDGPATSSPAAIDREFR